MIDISAFMKQFLQAVTRAFGERIWFVGLQGSYARGEANVESDLDTVLILDRLSALDVQVYHGVLDTLPGRDKLCGFLSGKNELLNWEPSELLSFYYDTEPVFGSLEELLTRIDEAAVGRAIKSGVCGIYHGCVHNMLYEKSHEVLKGLYKSASFVVQAIGFQQTGCYIRHQNQLLCSVGAEERAILETFGKLKRGESIDFQAASEALLVWSGDWIHRTP